MTRHGPMVAVVVVVVGDHAFVVIGSKTSFPLRGVFAVQVAAQVYATDRYGSESDR